MNRVLSALRSLNTVPLDDNEFANWLELTDAVQFLKENAEDEEFVLFAQAVPYTFIHAVLVPEELVSPPDVDDLMSWDCHPSHSWTTCTSFSEPPSVSIEGPLSYDCSKTLAHGEQLIFSRDFEGRTGQKEYIEILQKLTHLMDLHFLPERSAYCRLNHLGDLEDVIRVKRTSATSEGFKGTLVTIQRPTFDEYVALTGSATIRMFDVTRFRPRHFGGWKHPPNLKKVVDGDLYYRQVVEPRHASYIRGFQIVSTKTLKSDIARRFTSSGNGKQYVSLLAHDFKNQMLRDISLAPGETANYFTESELPFEMSPAFFRAEVLSKYKADSDKYQLGDRSISCRGGWHLQTYDINDAGQVHTYLVYLRSLPYEEQLHWKAYNERPKGPIAERAFKADFEGSWDIKIDPLNELKYFLLDLKKQAVPWWTLRSEKLLEQVHYPVTASADEWSNEILLLDQLTVEGFEEKYLRHKAESLGRKPAPRFRSLQLVEECLSALGYDDEQGKELVAPLRKIHNLRSKLKGHASGDSAIEIRKEVLTNHQSYRKHFESLCSGCADSIRTIMETFKDFTR